MSFKSDSYRLHTRAEWRFAERESETGAKALPRAHVRRTARLGRLLPAGIAVALAVGDDDAAVAHRAATCSRWAPSCAARPGPSAARHLQRLASRLRYRAAPAAREDLGLELDPHVFAEQDGAVGLHR